MSNYEPLENLIETVSVTHKFDKPSLVFLNTSDVLKGKILTNAYMPVSEMKGQAKKTIKNGDILYSEIRPKNRRYAFVKGLKNPEDYVVSTKLMVLRKLNDRIDNEYLYHFLTNNETINYLQGRAENRIGSFPQITFNILKSIKIWLPDISEQKQIAKVLSDLDAKIEINNKINTELEAMAKLIYNYWFVQFDFPDKNGKPYKSSGGKMEYNKELKREIPEGWEVGFLNDLYNFQYGKGNTNPDNGGDYPIYGSNGIIGGYDEFNSEDSPVIGHIGNNCGSLVYASGKHYVTYNGIICRIKEPFDKFFGYCTLLNKDLKSRTRGSSQKFISYDLLNQISFVIPESSIQKLFCSLVVPSYEKVIVNLRENEKLSKLRDWLLPMLMNGQVKVKKNLL